ncbi:MAG: hypothetical protein IKW31_01850 [Alistipes sp.]|nr:hypothetical protein [Alistipes sp.]
MKARFLALAALVLGLASCQTEPEGLNVNVGGEVDTIITVSLPDTETRANSALGAFENVVASDEYTIRYIFQVFYNGIESQAARQVIYTDYEQVSFPVRLVPGRHYNFVVWADVVPQGDKTMNTIVDYDATADYHYNTADLKSVAIIDNSWVAMDETRDAFTGHYDTAVDGNGEKYTSASSINLVLTRPFAKLRVITTDMEQLNDLNIIPTRATVQYTTQHYASFNAFAGGVNENDKMSKTHTNFAIKAYDDNVNDKSKVLFTDYFFAKDDQDVVNFTLTVYDQRCTEQDVQDDYIIKTNNFNTPIPAHRNNLTTISGNTLTEGNNITVEVTKDFENTPNPGDAPYYQETISSDVELLAALAKLQEPGANYKYIVIAPLTVDYSLISTLAATRAASTAFGSVTINLNGFTVTFVSNNGEPVITLPAGSELTLVNDSNEGGIIVTGEGTGAAIENNGSLNIEGVALQSESNGAVIENNNVANIEDSTLYDGALVNNENGQANIEGSTLNEGSVENNGDATITGSTLNEGAVENNGQANVNGGDVHDNAIENGEGAIVGSQSADDLKRAIKNAKVGEPNVFTLTGNVEGNIEVIQKSGVKITIDGANYKFNGYIKVHSNSNHYADAALTIKNVNFETSSTRPDKDGDPCFNFIEALENGSERYSTNITVEDCTFTATDAAVNIAVGLQIKASKNAKVLNCTATDMHSLIQAQSCDETVVVNGCTINGKNGVAFKQVKAATVEGTTITALEYGIRFDGNIDNYGIVVKNNEISAAQPFIVRKMTGKNNTIELEGENTLTSTREAYQIVITNGSDDAAYVAPTGTYTLTGADNFIVYPRDVVSSWSEFTTALADGKTFFLLAEDITYDANYQLQKDVTIDLNGKSMTLPMINVHSIATIKNGTINGKVYVRNNSNVTFDNVTFSGAVSDNLSTEGHMAIQGGCNLYVKDCLFSPTSVSGSQTKPLSFEGGSSNLKFEKCEFKNSPYKKQVYLNSLSATGSIEFKDCNFNNKTPNIMFAAACPLTNVTMSGTTKLSSVTFEINRAKDAVTEDDLAYLRTLIANNSFSSVRVFYAGGSSEYIR